MHGRFNSCACSPHPARSADWRLLYYVSRRAVLDLTCGAPSVSGPSDLDPEGCWLREVTVFRGLRHCRTKYRPGSRGTSSAGADSKTGTVLNGGTDVAAERQRLPSDGFYIHLVVRRTVYWLHMLGITCFACYSPSLTSPCCKKMHIRCCIRFALPFSTPLSSPRARALVHQSAARRADDACYI